MNRVKFYRQIGKSQIASDSVTVYKLRIAVVKSWQNTTVFPSVVVSNEVQNAF